MSQYHAADEPAAPIERKVQLTGNSTFVVSLPKEWAIEQGLESGQSMYLYPHDDRIVAAPERVSSRDRSVTIDASSGDERAVRRRVRAAYTTGCDRISVSGAAALDDDARRDLERLVGRLVGIEIQELSGDRLSIRNLLDAREVSLPQTVAQARQLALELFADAVDAVVSNDDDLARAVERRRDDVDRLVAFVSRGFHRGLADVREVGRLGIDRAAAFREYRTARGLERLAEAANRIAAIARRQSAPPAAWLCERLETVGTAVERAIESALAGESRRATESRDEIAEAVTAATRRLYEQCDSDPCLYGSLLEDLRRTADIGVEIAETTIEADLDG